MIRSGLDISGYGVLEAANVDEAVEHLERQPIDVVVAALNQSAKGRSSLLAAMRRRPEWEGIPVLAVADSAEEIESSDWQAKGFKDCQTKTDSVAIVESVARLVPAETSDEVELELAGEMR
jgi:CheY-like chemotaxis protein